MPVRLVFGLRGRFCSFAAMSLGRLAHAVGCSAHASIAGAQGELDGLAFGCGALAVGLSIHVERVAVEVDGVSVASQCGNVGIASERSGGAGLDLDVYLARIVGVDGAFIG